MLVGWMSLWRQKADYQWRGQRNVVVQSNNRFQASHKQEGFTTCQPCTRRIFNQWLEAPCRTIPTQRWTQLCSRGTFRPQPPLVIWFMPSERHRASQLARQTNQQTFNQPTYILYSIIYKSTNQSPNEPTKQSFFYRMCLVQGRLNG